MNIHELCDFLFQHSLILREIKFLDICKFQIKLEMCKSYVDRVAWVAIKNMQTLSNMNNHKIYEFLNKFGKIVKI
jgi:hypothetical protein